MFKRIVFGYSDARTEGVQSPRLLLEGFFENANITSDIFQGSRFLVLGHKGSGKSAIAERLRLLAESDYELFVSTCFLSDFPYDDFASIDSGLKDSAAGLAVAWSWVLLLKLAESFSEDQGGLREGQETLARLMQFLKARGFLPTDDLRDLIVKSHKVSFGAELPVFGKVDATHERDRETPQRSLSVLVTMLRSALLDFRSTSRHFVVIDGLDDILSARTIQYEVLEALVRTTARLNMDLQAAGVPAKVVLLCRTDLYERLPGANKSKLRQDHGVHLSWVRDLRSTQPSMLVRLANLRARLSTGGVVREVFESYFPATTHGVATTDYLLALTRHTPRDFLQLLSYIQRFADDGEVTPEQLQAGSQAYASEYFLPEIKDELAGYTSPENLQATIEILAALKQKEVDVQDVVVALRDHRQIEMPVSNEILRALFECSALGMVHKHESGEPYYTFRYRTRDAALMPTSRLITHPAMWLALDLMRGLSPDAT
jgi:energy-coupling factor transporter ATP-binding protein EcfA2